MTQPQPAKITDIPLSQLMPLHAMRSVTANDVRNALSPEYAQFAEQIAAVFSGENVEHPELFARNLNPEPQAEVTGSFIQSETSEIKDMSPNHESPQPQVPKKVFDWAAELAKLEAVKDSRTQVNEDDYTNLPASAFKVPYKGRQAAGWVVPEMHYEIEIPAAQPQSDMPEEEAYGYEPSVEESSDERHPVRIWWEPLECQPGEMVLYRVVADDKEMIESPEAGETLMITEGTAYRDHNPGESGLRHYSVWAYKGKDPGEIFSAQPVFMGETAVIYPPVNVKVTTIKGAIQVSWDLLDGHEGAVVYACKDNERDKLSPRFEQDIEASGRKATIRVQEAGQTMVVSLLGQAQFRSNTLTSVNEAAVQHSVKLASELEKMTITRCERVTVEGHDNIDIDWRSPKTGEVKIYLTPHAPLSELRTKAIDKSYVESAFADAVTETRGVAQPDSSQNTTVAWPPDWYEVYITPVNFNEADAWVGESKVLQRVLPIAENEVRLIERVDSQLISFNWPLGATMVEVTTNSGTSTVREEDYELQGGIRLNLERHSDRVHLRPFAMFAGLRTEAEERVLEYAGLRTVTYDILYDFPSRQVGVYLSSLDSGDKRPFSCQVVYNPERLPLHAEDGYPLKISGTNTATYTSQGLGQSTFQNPDFVVELDERTLRGGYLRLFAVAGFNSMDSGFDSFGMGSNDVFNSFNQSGFDSSEFNSEFKANDKAVVVERNVASRLFFPASAFNQQPVNFNDYQEGQQ